MVHIRQKLKRQATLCPTKMIQNHVMTQTDITGAIRPVSNNYDLDSNGEPILPEPEFAKRESE